MDWAGSVLNDVIILMIAEMVYYFTSLTRSMRETEQARLQAVQYQYDALKAQVNPHFLFNSLNLLHSLVQVDAERSQAFIHSLSRMYRYIMAQSGRESVSVAEELDFLGSYIEVLEMRYNGKFSVDITGAAPPEKRIIPFTMQLLIENVTKHNAITSRRPMQVEVRLGADGITISNPVVPKGAEPGTHFGLVYLRRLYSAHGREFHTEQSRTFFTAYIPYIN